MTATPSPSTVISAAVVMQLFFAVIAGTGAFVVDRNERLYSRFLDNPPHVGRQAWVTVAFALITIGSLVLSDGFAPSWIDLSGSPSFSVMTWGHALLLVFLADILWTFILVIQTSGSDRSAFSPIYFVLPSFAFFLRESPRRVLIYVILIVVFFTIGFFYSTNPHDGTELGENDNKFPLWWVSILCLILSLLLGFLTRVK